MVDIKKVEVNANPIEGIGSGSNLEPKGIMGADSGYLIGMSPYLFKQISLIL